MWCARVRMSATACNDSKRTKIDELPQDQDLLVAPEEVKTLRINAVLMGVTS